MSDTISDGEQAKKRPGRPAKAVAFKEDAPKEKERQRIAMVKWRYTKAQFREEWDPETDGFIKRPVEDFEKKLYKERVRFAEIARDNGSSWELERNDRLARAGKDNRIRIIDWYEIGTRGKEEDEDANEAVSEEDGLKVAVNEAGVANG